MELRLSLCLPRDRVSLPLTRRVLSRSLDALGVTDDCIGDIELAVSEACTNVLLHTSAGDEYEVIISVDADRSSIKVVDAGHGFDALHLGHIEADPSAEEGRGIQLIRALVDRVRFENRPEQGTIVHLEKRLEWQVGAPARLLTAANPPPVVDA